MKLAEFSLFSVVIAAVAGFVVGSVWYGVFGKRWLAAVGLTEADLRPSAGHGRLSPTPFLVAAVADTVMATMLAAIIGHFGEGKATFWVGIGTGFFCWLGFVVTTSAVNNSFAMRPLELTAIDTGHWLVVLLVMGAVIGGLG